MESKVQITSVNEPNNMNKERSKQLYNKATELFPGGVNSPVRAFKSVNGSPIFFKKGNGSKIIDEDDNEYIDFCCSWGPLILGHNNPEVQREIIAAVKDGTSFGAPTAKENQLGELIISNNRYIEQIRFVSSGTEAVMSAIRLARGYTSKSKIIKFEGCYHGHADYLLVEAGSGLATFGISSSDGVPESFVQETIVLPLNDKSAIEAAFEKHKDEIACIIIEPVPANNGLLVQDEEYLKFLRTITQSNGSLLIFDEVISGFRLGFEGAAGTYNIQPDIITYGKIIGGGMPVGAYGASKDIMSRISPEGGVYQAGTLSGNPVAMAAGIAQLKACLQPGFYPKLEDKCAQLCNLVNDYSKSKGYEFKMHRIESIFWIAFSSETKKAASEIDPNSMEKFKVLYDYLLSSGIYLGPSGYEVGFVSAAHTLSDIDQTANAIKAGLDLIFS